eukprot:TRINITY_DN5576_c0_g1_i1.p1 TRINITY_DN5576_c0_g1~~TRINITY_DN5576_c0_g1_i1.p1  ORF type:complete len:1599 (+),score=485.01 TRINITY_DN5576_c0_g1_i1:94-4890(+)
MAQRVRLADEVLLRGAEVRTPCDAQRVLEMRCGYDEKLEKLLGRVAVVEGVERGAVVLGYGPASFRFDFAVFPEHVCRKCPRGCDLDDVPGGGGGTPGEPAIYQAGYTCSACWMQMPAGSGRALCERHRFILCPHCLGRSPVITLGMHVLRGPTWRGPPDWDCDRVGVVAATTPSLLVSWAALDAPAHPAETTAHRTAPYADVMPMCGGLPALDDTVGGIQAAACRAIAARLERAAWWARVRAATSIPTRVYDPQTGFTLHPPPGPVGVEAAQDMWEVGNDLREVAAVGSRRGMFVTREVLDVEDGVERSVSVRIVALAAGGGGEALCLGVACDAPLDFATQNVGSIANSHALCCAGGGCRVVSGGAAADVLAPPLAAGDIVTVSVDESGGVLFLVNGVLLNNTPQIAGTYRFAVSLPAAGQAVAVDCPEAPEAVRRAYSARLAACAAVAARARPAEAPPQDAYDTAEGWTLWGREALGHRGVVVSDDGRAARAASAAPAVLMTKQVASEAAVEALAEAASGIRGGCAVTWKIEALPSTPSSSSGGGGDAPPPVGPFGALPPAPQPFVMFGVMAEGGEGASWDTQHLGAAGAVGMLVSRASGVAVVAADGTAADLAVAPLRAGDVLRVAVFPDCIRYFLNACLVHEQQDVVSAPVRFAASLCHAGAAVSLCGDDVAATSPARREATLPHQLDHGYLPWPPYPDGGGGGFIDSIPSIQVSHGRRRATCVETAHATILSRGVFDADERRDAPVAASYRLVKRHSPAAAVTFGITPAAPGNYRSRSVGMTELEGSMGLLSQDGKSYLACDGEGNLVDAPPLHPGDVVTVSVHPDRVVHFAVNGRPVQSDYSGRVRGRFRFGVSIIIRGTVVDLVEGYRGDEGMNSDEEDAPSDAGSLSGSERAAGSPRRRANEGFSGGGGRLYASTLQVGREVRAPPFSDRVVNMRCSYTDAMRRVLGRTALVEGASETSAKLNFGCDSYVFDYDLFAADVRRVCHEDSCPLALTTLDAVTPCSSCHTLLPRRARARHCREHAFTLCMYCCGVPETLVPGTRVVRGQTWRTQDPLDVPPGAAAYAPGTVVAVGAHEVDVQWEVDGRLVMCTHRGAPYQDVMALHGGGYDGADAPALAPTLLPEERNGAGRAGPGRRESAAAPRICASQDDTGTDHDISSSSSSSTTSSSSSSVSSLAASPQKCREDTPLYTDPNPTVSSLSTAGWADAASSSDLHRATPAGDALHRPRTAGGERPKPPPLESVPPAAPAALRFETTVGCAAAVAPERAAWVAGGCDGAELGGTVVHLSKQCVVLAHPWDDGDAACPPAAAPAGEATPTYALAPQSPAPVARPRTGPAPLVWGGGSPSVSPSVSGSDAPGPPPQRCYPRWALAAPTLRRCSHGCVLHRLAAPPAPDPAHPDATVCTACLTILPTATPRLVGCAPHGEVVCPFCCGGAVPVEEGMRVARGPTWPGGCADGGAGGAGRVAAVGGGQVAVVWDVAPGETVMYRAAAQDVVPAVPNLSPDAALRVLQLALAGLPPTEESLGDGLRALDEIKRAFSEAFDADAAASDLTSVLAVLALMEESLTEEASFGDIIARMEALRHRAEDGAA